MIRTLHISLMAAGLALLMISCSKKDYHDNPGNGNSGSVTDTIATLKAAASFPIGFAIENSLFMNNSAYHDTVVREGSSVTFGNEMKYGSIVQNDGSFNFTTADALV